MVETPDRQTQKRFKDESYVKHEVKQGESSKIVEIAVASCTKWKNSLYFIGQGRPDSFKPNPELVLKSFF